MNQCTWSRTYTCWKKGFGCLLNVYRSHKCVSLLAGATVLPVFHSKDDGARSRKAVVLLQMDGLEISDLSDMRGALKRFSWHRFRWRLPCTKRP